MKKTILVVDDDALNRQIIIDMLNAQNEKFSVLSANNGEVACKIAEKFIPDLILMDWSMPGMTGEAAILHLRKNDATKNIPVIVITGISSSELLTQIKQTGVINYIVKPVNRDELFNKINEIL